MSAARRYLAGVRPDLPWAFWIFLIGYALSAVGTGLVLPFNAIYLSRVRGFPLATVGTVLGAVAVASLFAGPVGVRLADRIDVRRVMALGLGAQGAGFLGLALADTLPRAFAAAAAIGAGGGLFSSGSVPLIARLTSAGQRPAAFAAQNTGSVLGLGVGAALGGLLLAPARPATFTIAYVADAASFWLYALILLAIVPAQLPAPHDAAAPDVAHGYGAALRDGTFRWLLGLHLLIATFGFAQIESSVPLYANAFLGVSTGAVGLMFALNNLLVLVAQLPLAAAIRPWPRTRVLAGVGAVWAGAWLLVGLAGSVRGAGAALALALFYAVFAIGECLFSPSFWPLVTGLGPAEALGRRNVLLNFSWYGSQTLGPALGAWLLSTPARGLLPLLFALIAATIGVGALRLEGRIPSTVNRPPAE